MPSGQNGVADIRRTYGENRRECESNAQPPQKRKSATNPQFEQLSLQKESLIFLIG